MTWEETQDEDDEDFDLSDILGERRTEDLSSDDIDDDSIDEDVEDEFDDEDFVDEDYEDIDPDCGVDDEYPLGFDSDELEDDDAADD